MRKSKAIVMMLWMMAFIISSLTWVQNVGAEEADTSDTTYNIEVVVDASGSLQKTDAENNRYTAIDIFLQTLRENGNNVGAVVFTSEIQADTGLSEMNSKSAKEKLSNQIKKYVPKKGDTNIGLALQTAANNLEKCDNNSENIILLLSDGNTDMGSEKADKESLAIEDKAIKQCISDDIKVYGICLNNNGEANLNEFKNISESTDGAFLEVKSSDNLVSALKNFYGQIFNTKFVSDTKTIKNGAVTKSIEVPSYGVEELNITINNASKLSNVTVTEPSGVDMSSNEFSGASSVIGDYYFIKITNPDSGPWKVTARGQEGTKITFDVVFNTENKVNLKTSSGANSFSLNESVDFNAGFYVNDKKLTGKKYYENYTGTLVVNFKDRDNQNLQYYPMESDGENGFKGSLTYDKEGNYEVYAVLTCGEFESMSSPIAISVGNALPTFSGGEDGEEAATVKIIKLFRNSKTIDLGEFFSDKEDKDISYNILASSYEDNEIEGPKGNEIVLKNLVDGKITVQAQDKDGGQVKGVVQIEVLNLGWIIILIIVLVLLVIAAIIAIKVREAAKRFFAGYLNIFSASEVDDSMSRPASNFRGKYSFANFGLMNHQFDNDMYFKVLRDKSVPGYGSHKLRLVSSKMFYYLSPSGEKAVKSLDMTTGMTYDIRSTSQEDPTGFNDTVSISLEEGY